MTLATPKQRRLFYALWPDEITRSALARVQFELHGNKTRYRNFHITLAFLGDQPEAMLPELQAILTRIDSSEMNLELNRIGYFTKQRIAWAGMRHEPPGLKQLQTDLTAQLSEHHVRFESRALFRPHITLVRDADDPGVVEFPPIVWHAKQVTLMQSETLEDGLQYKVLASHWLQRAR